ncbi:MAG: PEP-CTERM sorting domain-containing protein [Thermodesulfobacteriota bacterium]
MKTLKSFFIFVWMVPVALVSLALSPIPVLALPLTIGLDTEFSGAQAPSSPSTPWLAATFTDHTDGTVVLKMEATNLTGSEFVSDWYLNLDPNLAVTSLTFTYDTYRSSVQATSFLTGSNAFKADGDGYFDIKFSFDTANVSTRFGEDDYSVYVISGIPGLTASSFNFYSAPGGGNGSYRSAAHVQGIDDPNSPGIDTDGSGWIGDGDTGGGNPPVPEPATMLLVGSGLVGLAGIRRKKFFKKIP